MNDKDGRHTPQLKVCLPVEHSSPMIPVGTTSFVRNIRGLGMNCLRKPMRRVPASRYRAKGLGSGITTPRNYPSFY